MIVNPHLLPKVRSHSLRSSVARMPCCLRIASLVPGLTCSGSDTVVGAHMPSIGRGVSTKGSDLCMVAACRQCHDLLDIRDGRGHDLRSSPDFWRRVVDGWSETLARWIDMGLLDGKDWEVLR